MTEAFSADVFRPYVGQSVSLPHGLKLTLVSVDEGDAAAPGGSPRAFSLILRGAPAPILGEGVHRLTFEDSASYDLYLIPIHTPSRAYQDYQIVFN